MRWLERGGHKTEVANQFGGAQERPLDVYLVNVEAGHMEPLGLDLWKKEDRMQVRLLNVPISHYGVEDLTVICQLWVKRRILAGVGPAEWS